MLKRISKALVPVFLLALPAAAQEFEKGLDAYNRGAYATALSGLRPLALKGERRAQHYLAFMYLRGKGLPQSDAEAVKWFRKAAEQGYIKAQYNLAVMYHIGLGAKQSDSEAVKWFRKAADQGHLEAQQNLLFMRTKGRRATMRTSSAPVRTDLRDQLSTVKSMRNKDRRVTTKAPTTSAREDLRGRIGTVKAVREKDRPVTTKAPTAPTLEDFHIQLGAVKLKDRAVKEAGRLNRVHKLVLGKLKIVPIRSDLGKRGIFYRLRAGPLKGWSSANSLCRKLSARKQRCIVANP